MSKGSLPRQKSVSAKAYSDNWARTFQKEVQEKYDKAIEKIFEENMQPAKKPRFEYDINKYDSHC